MLTSWIAGQLDLSFHVDEFWPSAVLGALLIGVVSWLLKPGRPATRTDHRIWEWPPATVRIAATAADG